MYKVGIIGTGYLQEEHIKNWLKIAHVSLAGFYDPGTNTARIQELAPTLKSFTSLDELIDACDIIDIGVPVTHRFAVCEKAIQKGKHVLVAKPMAFSMTEANQLVKLVQESNVKLQVAGTQRFNPAYQSMKGLSLKPEYIEVHHSIPYSSNNKDTNPVFNLLIQDIDTVLSIVESEVKNIAASGATVATETPDLVNARIEFNNGCVANLTASCLTPKAHSSWRLFQKEGITYIDFLENHIEVLRAPYQQGQTLSSNPSDTRPSDHANPLTKELEAFVACIRNNTRPVVNEIDGYRALEVAHQILKKINSNLSAAH